MADLTPIQAAAPLDTSDDSRVSFAADTTETRSFALDNVDSNLLTMSTASWQIEYRQVNQSDDTIELSLRIMSGTTVLAAADSGGTFVVVDANVTNTTDATLGPTAFSYVDTAASRATWDAAVVEIQQVILQNMSKDGLFAEIDFFELTGTYEVAPDNAFPDDSMHSHASESPAVSQIHDVTTEDAFHANAVESPTVSQVHSISPENSDHSHQADSPSVFIIHIINPDDTSHVQNADSANISQIHSVIVNDTFHTHIADEATVLQIHLLSPNDSVHTHTAESPSVSIISFISPANSEHVHTADNVATTQKHRVLIVSPTGVAYANNFTETTTGTMLMNLDKDNGLTAHGELIEVGATGFALDDANKQIFAVEFVESIEDGTA